MRSCSDSSNIAVVMLDDLVQIRLCGHLDRAATAALIGIVGAAASCGPMVMVDLDQTGPDPGFVPSMYGAATDRHGSAEPQVVGEGHVRLQSASVWWTIDTKGRRLFRSDVPVDHRFVDHRHWVAIRKMWVTAGATTVSTEDGSLLSIATSWASHQDNGTTRRSGRLTPRRRAA